MQPKKSYKAISLLLLVLPLLWIGVRIISNTNRIALNELGHRYELTYDFSVRGEKPYWIETFVPQNDDRQTISVLQKNLSPKTTEVENNKVARWEGTADGLEEISLSFLFQGKSVEYQISDEIIYSPYFSISQINSLSPTNYIQSDNETINKLAQDLKGELTGLKDILKAYYSYVYALPSNGTNELTDAVTAFEDQEASCNGKSRLLVALCRATKIPARMIGGIIMEASEKKTSHAWVEIKVNETWVPFDPLNGYFSALPSHYLKLYAGDNFLITRSPGITFDYEYKIQEQRNNSFAKFALLDLWQLSDAHKVPLKMLRVILLLPLGALLIGILKNVIGFKTIGVFLPVLISVALIETGLVTGLILFTGIIFIVAGLNYPLTKWGVQHTAKLTLMMSAVVIVVLGLVQGFSNSTQFAATTPLFFPFIILTLVSEKVARTIDEDGFRTAMEMYLQTLAVTVIIFFVLNSTTIQNFLITFPEIMLTFAGINLLLGKWIGFRVLEYGRFLNTVKA
ncbi:7TM domain-containing protein [Roseivirga sp.]|uniref:7TM domain-containing protein n=1 Tax=Roseivirga sp. TaxID=1964215 RepID=UPI003B8D3D7B